MWREEPMTFIIRSINTCRRTLFSATESRRRTYPVLCIHTWPPRCCCRRRRRPRLRSCSSGSSGGRPLGGTGRGTPERAFPRRSKDHSTVIDDGEQVGITTIYRAENMAEIIAGIKLIMHTRDVFTSRGKAYPTAGRALWMAGTL